MRVRIPSGLPFPFRLTAGHLTLTQRMVVRIHQGDPVLLPLRLVGRAPDFDSGRVGSNPTGASSFINQVKEVYYE